MGIFSSGLVLMVTGMSVVFIFLILMIILMDIMNKIINSLFPEMPAVPNHKSDGPTKDELTAIREAVSQFIRSNK